VKIGNKENTGKLLMVFMREIFKNNIQRRSGLTYLKHIRAGLLNVTYYIIMYYYRT